MKHLTSLLVIIMMSAAGCQAAALQIADNGKSTYTIVVPAKAPASVQDAAAELQKDIQLSTGAKLTLEKDSAKVTSPIISLGDTAQANAVGISSNDMSDDTYRIVTKDGNLYILGVDTPDGGWTKTDGVSDGTANGVYTFLEDYLDVLWLMPGDLGRSVPRKGTFTIDDINREHTPFFTYRQVTNLDSTANSAQRQVISDWAAHQRVGSGSVQRAPVNVRASESFWTTINLIGGGSYTSKVDTPAVKKAYQEHPDWFAMNAAGERPLPTDSNKKLETTNKGLVRAFAEEAIKSLKASQRPNTYSLSPSDGGGWSQSPESKALYDPPPLKSSNKPSMSSLVLKFYHDVAQIVAKEYPQGRLAGYLYSSYTFPPIKVDMKLPENFTPVIAPSDFTYGYKMYRPESQKQWDYIMSAWSKVIPNDWYYYDLPNQLLRQDENLIGITKNNGSTGIITPAAPDILNIIYPGLVKYHNKGPLMYGVPAWSNAAMANYLLAKLEWDPQLNVYDVQREWLSRAYGADAGKIMGQFYIELNGWYSTYYQQHIDGVSFRLKVGMFKDIYAAHYPEMEKLLLRAKSQKMTERQQQRLQMIEDNLIVLQWRLRNGGFLRVDFKSSLSRTNTQVIAIITQPNDAFPLFPGAVTSRSKNWEKPKAFPWKVQFSQKAPTAPGKSKFEGLEDGQYLIYAAQDEPIHIIPKIVTQGAYYASYEIQNQAGKVIQSGILNVGTPITIPAKAGEAYYLLIPPRKPVNYKLEVQHAAKAESTFTNKTLTLSGKPAAVYVYGPSNRIETETDSVVISTMSMLQALLQQYQNTQLIKLDKDWKFYPDDQADAAKVSFNDSAWKPISTAKQWQLQGFDYHGAAWYRQTFTLPQLHAAQRGILYFGAIDGNAVVYVNGKKVGDHRLGDKFEGWDEPFFFDVSPLLLTGKNTITVQVTSKNDNTASGIQGAVNLVIGTPK